MYISDKDLSGIPSRSKKGVDEGDGKNLSTLFKSSSFTAD